MSRLRLPGRTGRLSLGAAGLSWVGAMAGWTFGYTAFAVCCVVALVAAASGRWVAGALVVAAAASGWAAAGRVSSTLTAPVPEGPAVLSGRVADEPVRGRGRIRFVLQPDGRLAGRAWHEVQLPRLAVATRDDAPRLPTAGDRVVVRGILEARPGRVRGDPVAGRVSGASVEIVASSANPLFVIGNALRRRVASRLDEENDPRAALISGFLIGDTAGLGEDDTEALRRAGLSHFVAVSGSNVALFLAGWWIVTAPFALRPRVRALIGLVGLAIFVVVTRWEPSVVRAASMAGLVLGGRVFGLTIDTWTALGAAVTGLLLLSGDLAFSVGFQLSVVAAAGVMAGASIFAGRRPRWLWTALGATLSAQVAVVPLLLFHFGAIPLLSPLANLLAVPVVTVATVLGGIGVVGGIDFLLGMALTAAGGVLRLARLAAGWPQLGLWGAVSAGGAGLVLAWKPARPFAATAAAMVGVVLNLPGAPAEVPTITFLDVGQGDSVLLADDLGTVVLVDGGGDSRVLDAALRRNGVGHVDLLVVTHGDGDHAAGLESIFSRLAVGELWVPDQPDLGAIVPRLVADAAARGTPVLDLRAGHTRVIGRFTIEVLGPQRRYASENDGSIVLWVEAEGRDVLLPGDIEAVAQRELPRLRPDILLVPHHGSATTDLEWLATTVGRQAVISVGENAYGHPSPDVVAVLAAAGAQTWLTREYGDVTVPLR